MVAMALKALRWSERAAGGERALKWLLAFQNTTWGMGGV